jgi:hypothetical protein
VADTWSSGSLLTGQLSKTSPNFGQYLGKPDELRTVTRSIKHCFGIGAFFASIARDTRTD